MNAESSNVPKAERKIEKRLIDAEARVRAMEILVDLIERDYD